jgi:hypothetical protein
MTHPPLTVLWARHRQLYQHGHVAGRVNEVGVMANAQVNDLTHHWRLFFVPDIYERSLEALT